MDQGDRPRFIERTERPKTPTEAKQRRSSAMITGGVICLLAAALAMSGGGLAYLLGLLGVGLLVGGLVIR